MAIWRRILPESFFPTFSHNYLIHMAPTTAKTTKSTSKGKAVTLDTTNKDIEAIFST